MTWHLLVGRDPRPGWWVQFLAWSYKMIHPFLADSRQNIQEVPGCGWTTKYRVWRCPVLVLTALVTVQQFRDLSQGWALSLQASHFYIRYQERKAKLSTSTGELSLFSLATFNIVQPGLCYDDEESHWTTVNNYITISIERGTLDWQLDTANHKYRHFGKHSDTDIVQVSYILYIYIILIYIIHIISVDR